MDTLLQKLAKKISLETNQDDEIMLFSLRVLWNFFAGYALLSVSSLLLGIFIYSIIAALSSSILKVMSGGAHASSSNRCLVYGTLIFLFLGYLGRQIIYYTPEDLLNISIVLIWVTGVPVIFKYATSSITGKPLGTYSTGRKFRNISICCLSIWAVVVLNIDGHANSEFSRIFTVSSLMGVSYQIYSLTPWGYKTVDIVDKLLSKIHI